MTMPKIIGIMATTNEGVVGKDNGLPWNYKDELEHFRQTTNRQTMVMGRKTFETTPENLFKRTPIVFSKTLTGTGIVSSIPEFLDYIKNIEESKIFMIGGAELAELFLKNNLISEFILTKIHKNYMGDVRMNLNYFNHWQSEIILSNNNYTIYRFKNPQS